MNEHDDDLASEVQEDAAEETDSYPATAEDFEESQADALGNGEAETGELDEDETEL